MGNNRTANVLIVDKKDIFPDRGIAGLVHDGDRDEVVFSVRGGAEGRSQVRHMALLRAPGSKDIQSVLLMEYNTIELVILLYMCLKVTATNATHHYGCRGTPSNLCLGSLGPRRQGWDQLQLLDLLLQLIEVVSVDNIHLEQLLLLAAQQSLHNIHLGGHLHPRHESVYGVTVLPRQFRHTAVYSKDIVIVVEWNENYKD